jgi:hypothetical protein
MLMHASHTTMSDQYQFMDDLMDWDDWLQAEEQQPFW